MTAVRAWRRQLYGGLGAALIVPATLVAALGVLAFAGGFARLGVLGQALSGPPVPAGARASAAHARAAGLGSRAGQLPSATAPAHVLVPGAVTSPSRGAARSAPSSGHAAPGPGVGRTHPPAPAAPTHPGGGSSGPGSSSGGGGSSSGGGGSSSGGGSGSPGTPSPKPTLTDGVVSAATSVTNQVPAPSGPAATEVLKSVGAVVDAVAPLPPPGQSSPSASPSVPASVPIP